MAYRHPRIPLSRERKVRASWAGSFKPADRMDRLLAEIHPNPEPVGRPGVLFVWTAAMRQVPDVHPVFSHLTDCSPCYREYRGIQQTESSFGPGNSDCSEQPVEFVFVSFRKLRRLTRHTPLLVHRRPRRPTTLCP